MDQIKIGKFIAELRREKGLTQRRLAERLHISEKTVSKWECGGGMPDVSSMLPLCRELEIDVNELLSGERLQGEKYRQEAEDHLLHMMDKTSPKVRYTVCTVSAIVTIVVVLGLIMISAYAIQELWIKILTIIFCAILIPSNIAVILLIAVNTEIYECCHCGKKFIPTMGEYILGPHTLTKRYLKCPHCHKKGYHKFKIDNKKS